MLLRSPSTLGIANLHTSVMDNGNIDRSCRIRSSVRVSYLQRSFRVDHRKPWVRIEENKPISVPPCPEFGTPSSPSFCLAFSGACSYTSYAYNVPQLASNCCGGATTSGRGIECGKRWFANSVLFC